MSSASGGAPGMSDTLTGGSLSPVIPFGNERFLKSVFEGSWGDAHVCTVPVDPADRAADWSGGRVWQLGRHLSPDNNNYFTVSTFTGFARREDEFQALWVLGIDDVGVKLSDQAVRDLLGEPTFRIATSVGNEQWGYRLAVPLDHPGVARALQRAVRVALTGVEGKDPGQEQLTRYMRLPEGRNLKRTARDWKVFLVSWSGRTISWSALCTQLAVPGPSDPSWDSTVGRKLQRLAANRQAGQAGIEDDLLLRAMRELDLVLGQARDSAMGTGFDVRCPWIGDHTDRGDTGTFFAPGRGFKCHHGHCDGKGIPDLPERLDELLREDSGGLVCLGSLDFDDVDPATVPVVKVAPPAKLTLDGKVYTMTEDSLALAFVDTRGNRLRYDHTRKVWVIWERGPLRWELDGTEQAFDWARRLARKLREQNDTREAMALAKISAAAAIERGARADRRVSTTILSWDRDPLAISAAGVHVELGLGTMRTLDPRDMIMRSASVIPDPNMPTPIWDRFMQETFNGDIDTIEFMHAWFGYGLTGDMSAEKFVFLFGTGGNGKGVLVHTMSQIAGSYAITIGSDLLTERKFQGHPTELARLCGARMAFATEVDDNARWSLKTLKLLTGNEGTLHGRFMRQDFFEFQPTTKLTIVGNHKPAIGYVDEAIARRLLLVPFLATPAQPDPSLKARLVAEYPGILWQLVEGAGRTLTALAPGGTGFHALVPQVVVDASREYLVAEDGLALWLRERCENGSGASVLCSEAYRDYEAWCLTEGRATAVGARKFSEEVKRAAVIAGMPITVGHREKGTTIAGVRLKPVAIP